MLVVQDSPFLNWLHGENADALQIKDVLVMKLVRKVRCAELGSICSS